MSREALTFVVENFFEMPSDKSIGRDRVRLVYENLVSHASQLGEVWVSEETQARERGLGRRDIQNARGVLFKEGLLIDTGKKRNRGVKVLRVVVPGFNFESSSCSASPSSMGDGLGVGAGDGVVVGVVVGAGDGVTQGETVVRVEDQGHNRTELELEQKDERQLQELHEATFTKHRKIKKCGYNSPLSHEWGQRYRPYLEHAIRVVSLERALKDDVLCWVIAQAFPDDLQVSYTLENLPGVARPQHETTYNATREQEHLLANFQNSFGN